MLDKLWDDVVAGPQPERGLGKLRKIFSSKPLVVDSNIISSPPPPTPTYPKSTPSTPAGTPRDKTNVWRSVFNPGSNSATKTIGSDIFDKPQPNSPSVYDWLYSGETKSIHR
ncbi:Auxin-repressed protein [Zostera marina]|uniref:Auxin-repressed protein n=1 Tax=Zostera marina TaxID=29655 RepID=A0A0K9Q5N5_ZOSMR|nr:Auxin-repressed protein [Zostera marina]